jgi:Skp family chaperone for outer membrane proteins
MKFNVCISCLIVFFVLMIPAHGWAQKKQLTPVSAPLRIAFIDPAKLRKDYRAYSAAKDSMYKSGIAQRKSFETAKHQLDEQIKKQLKKDNVEGTKQNQLPDNGTASRTALETKYVAEIKQRNTDRIALMKNYEDKINNAMQTVMAEGAYTDLKTLKDTTGLKGTDITDIILKKLNN